MAQPDSGFSPEKLLQALPPLAGLRTLWVAYSGGRDSHVLLHALAELRAELACALKAVHVDHGLQPESGRWASHCEAVCRALGVDYVALKVDATPLPGESPEAAARKARYAALAELMGAGDGLCTAHHQDDQAETLLLQLCRGAGPKGLAAMPEQGSLGQARLIRPLLGFSRQALTEYALGQGLVWIEDPSSADTSLSRNFVRHRLMPVFRQQWPSAARSISRSARHCAEAAELMADLAALDLAAVAGAQGGTLAVDRLRQLTVPRQKNLLRHWLTRQGFAMPSEVKLQHLLNDVVAARADALPCVAWAGVEIRRFRGLLYAVPPAPSIPAGFSLPWDGRSAVAWPDGSLIEAGEGEAGSLCLDEKRLRRARLALRVRQGGESIRPRGSAHHRSLKKLLQESGVPPWLRSRQPLLYADDELIAVVGLCVSAAWAAPEGEPGVVVRWRV